MKEHSQEIGMGSVLLFPSDIQYLKYSGRILAVAVDTANWLVLHSDAEVSLLESLRKGSTVGEVLSALVEPAKKQPFLKLLSAIMARQFAGTEEVPQRETVRGYEMLNIYLTNACNLSCPHCFMRAGKRLKNELSAEDWIDVLNQFADVGGKAITLTGGEPLMNPAFTKIVESAFKLGLETTVLTNGILWTDTLIDRLSPMLGEVQISIDGVDDESNAKVRKSGVFDLLVNNVIRFAKNGVRTSVATTFTNDNIEDADRYADLVAKVQEETGDKVIFKLTKKILPGREIQYTEDENKVYEARIRAVEDKINPNAKHESFMEGHTPNLVASNCGFGGLSIAADGNVYLCNRVLEVESQGNVKERPLSEFLALGKVAHEKTGVDYVIPCKDCALRYICGGGCRIDEYDFKGKSWREGQTLHQVKCKGPIDYLLRMMVESYEYKYSF